MIVANVWVEEKTPHKLQLQCIWTSDSGCQKIKDDASELTFSIFCHFQFFRPDRQEEMDYHLPTSQDIVTVHLKCHKGMIFQINNYKLWSTPHKDFWVVYVLWLAGEGAWRKGKWGVSSLWYHGGGFVIITVCRYMLLHLEACIHL